MSKKKQKKLGLSKRWYTAYWQSCKTATCGKSTPANAVDPEQLQPESWVPVARVPVWLVEISAQTRITCKMVGLFVTDVIDAPTGNIATIAHPQTTEGCDEYCTSTTKEEKSSSLKRILNLYNKACPQAISSLFTIRWTIMTRTGARA